MNFIFRNCLLFLLIGNFCGKTIFSDISKFAEKKVVIDFKANHRCDNSFVIQKLRCFIF